MVRYSALNKKPKCGLLIILALLICLAGSAAGVEVSYVGTIHDGLSAPTSLHASADHIAALQPYNRQLLVFTPQGTLTRLVDIEGETHGLARLNETVYLFCDRGRKRVTAVDLNDGRQWTFTDFLGDPIDIVVDEDKCYILDSGSRGIVVTDLQGHTLHQIDLAPGPEPSMKMPAGMAFDKIRNVFHVFDQLTSRVIVYAYTGEQLGTFCSFGGESGTVTRGGGLVCDTDGYIYIADRYQGRVSIFDPEWRFVLDVDTRSFTGNPLTVPAGIAVDPEGTIYVASTEDNRIHVFFLDKTAVPPGDLVAVPLFPGPAGNLSASDVKLAIRLGAVSENGNNLAADFRIVTAQAPEALVAEKIGATVDELGLDDQGRLVGTATWQLESALLPGTEYLWQARARRNEQVGRWFEPVMFTTYPAAVPFNLEANYPNPFNPSTTIAFTVPSVRKVTLTIYDLQGNRVWSTALHDLEAGRHTVTWNGRNTAGNPVASGVYFYQMRAEDFEQSRKMVLIK
jgi:DNA-binding beta-propeller fold protein YncE